MNAKGGGMGRQLAALPWRQGPDGIEILLLTSRETKRWVIPKGWPMADKAPHEAAAQEALEEAGVTGTVDERPAGFYPYMKKLKDGSLLPCLVAVYPLKVKAELDDWREKDQREKLWTTLDDAAERVEEPDLKTLILAFRP